MARKRDQIDELDLTPSPRLLEVLGSIPYKPWQCLAELIDNAFDDFLQAQAGAEEPQVSVRLPKSTTTDEESEVVVTDNGRGLTREQLGQALKAGYSSNARYGSLGLFGMGFNIATARLGYVTEVRTAQSGEPDWLVATIDFHELQRQGNFRVPVRREAKSDPGAHGTAVTVRRLRSEIGDSLRRPNTASSVREQLGNVYSYLLRSKDVLPELPAAELAGRGYTLTVNGVHVRPRLPCLWDASRVVSYRGTEIAAVQPIDKELTPAVACMACGHWHRAEVDNCVECGSDQLEVRDRRIVGWVGLQRYLHSSDFGIDFLRNGRKILLGDKSVFTWENPDTGERLTEYPIELPANQGRIVGEVHLDHVPVLYQKNDFERGSRDWINAVSVVRGEGPLQPRKAKGLGYGDNRSPLGLLYAAFRRNDAGLTCLIPGDGKEPLHETSRKWAEQFRKGLRDFLGDDRWYEAAFDHDEIKSGVRKAPIDPPEENEVAERTGLNDPPANGAENPQGTPPSVPETEEQRFARYRHNARRMLDLAGDVSLGTLGRRTVEAYDTSEQLVDASGTSVPCVARSVKGGRIEVYVQGDHEVFREYGRDPRDYAIVELAEALRAMAKGNGSVSATAALVTTQFPDQRFTDAALRERADAVVRRMRELIGPIATKHSGELWASLPTEQKEAAELNAATLDPRLDWRQATADGSFSGYMTPAAIATVASDRPDLMFDGAVFCTAWAGWTDSAARHGPIERIVRLLGTLDGFQRDTSPKSRLDLALTRLTLEMLEDELNAEALP